MPDNLVATREPMQEASLRDLSDEEFADRYACDRLTAAVLASKYQYVVQHMCTGLLTTAFSPILRDWYDFAATLTGPPEQDYPMPAVSNSLIIFTGTMAEAVRNMVEEFGVDRLKPGDVLIANDPYRVGTHVNDVCCSRPIFAGSSTPVGFVTIQAHMLDMGGVVPGGFSATKRTIYENGLILAPCLLYHEDVPQRAVWSLLHDNARFADVMLADLRTIYQNLSLGEHLVTQAIQRYGLEAYAGAIRYACDSSAQSMRQAIGRVPPGVYEGEGWVDCDGVDDSEEYRIAARVAVADGHVEVDLSGSSRQARTSINAGWLDTKTAVGVALKFLLDPTSPFTSATFRDIDIVLPHGTIVSALPPDGPIFMNSAAAHPAMHAVLRALSSPLGADAVGGDCDCVAVHNANGIDPTTGSPWMTMAQCGGEHGPWAGTRAGDGDSYNVFYMANSLDPATESIEADAPVVVLRKEYVIDSAGAGAHRGGAAVMKDSLWLTDTEHYAMAMHVKRSVGFGVHGGRDGTPGGVWMWPTAPPHDADAYDAATYEAATPVAGMLNPESHAPDPDGEYFHYGRVPVWRTDAGAMFRYLTNGGGGWGDPLDRDPDAVRRDVRDGYVSVEGAARDYGVVILGNPCTDPEGLAVDAAATKRLRARSRQRGRW